GGAPAAREDVAEGRRAGVEAGPARVVLEARERSLLARLELTLEEDVADHPPLSGDGPERKNGRAGHVLPVEAAAAAPQELVAAADRQHRGSARDRLAQLGRLRGHVPGDEELLAVLAAADVEKVVVARPELLADADRL